MKIRWLSLGILNSSIFFSVALAAAYPEMIWLDAINAPTPVAQEPTFQLEPELFQASAIKDNECSLGGQLGCALQ